MTPKTCTKPVAGLAQAARALRQAGECLIAAASALEGQIPQIPANILSLPPTHAPPDAAGFYSVSDLIGDFLRYKARQDKSDRYLRTLRVTLLSFAKGRKERDAGAVTVREVEDWLAGQEWAARTKKGYLGDVRTMYNWARKRNLVGQNPAAAVEVPSPVDRPPAIYTPEVTARILEFARGYRDCICRALAIQFFAGLRTAEVERIEESQIRLDIGVIEVPATKAKTRRRRPVAIQPNLLAWLKLGGRLPFHDCGNTWRFFRQALEKKEGIAWLANAPRHSFVSYHLQEFGSASRTAIEAGHSEQMVFAHYRALVPPAAAAAYWNILPKEKAPGGEPGA